MINLKKENGSVAVMVFITILFMITILSASFIMASTQRKSQLKSQLNLKRTYEEGVDNADQLQEEAYNKITLAQLLEMGQIEIGDYINYDPTAGATTLTVESKQTENGYADTLFRLSGNSEEAVSYDNSLGWKILGVNEDGNLLITTADVVYPVSGGYNDNGVLKYALYGRVGYKNAITELDKICSLYGQNSLAKSARSMKIDDVNAVIGYDPEDIDGNGTPYNQGQINEYGNRVTYYWNERGTPYYTCSNSEELTDTLYYAHNPFYYWDGSDWQEARYSNNSSEEIVELTNTVYSYYINIANALKRKLLFSLQKDYCLASRNFYAETKYANFGMHYINRWDQASVNSLAYSHSNTGANSQRMQSYAVRPAVELKPTVRFNGGSGTLEDPYLIR